MARFAQLAAVAVALSQSPAAWGHGLALIRAPVTVTYYYAAPIPCVRVVPVAMYPVCVPPPPVYPLPPQPTVPARTYAPPTAAPPSPGPSTPEPPLAAPPTPAKPQAAPPSRSPGFGESTSFYDTYPVDSQSGARLAGEQCNVDFWNLTGGDLVLRINGEPGQVLPRNKDLPVRTGRHFTWQVDGRETQTTRVDTGERALQIVIRR